MSTLRLGEEYLLLSGTIVLVFGRYAVSGFIALAGDDFPIHIPREGVIIIVALSLVGHVPLSYAKTRTDE